MDSPIVRTSWADPANEQRYPTAYPAYRRMREAEAEEKPMARHRALGPDVDYYLWRRGHGNGDPGIDVLLTVRRDTPPRIRRLIGDVLLAIRRGRRADEAIRQVARRFGLRDTRARAFIGSWISFELRPRARAGYVG